METEEAVGANEVAPDVYGFDHEFRVFEGVGLGNDAVEAHEVGEVEGAADCDPGLAEVGGGELVGGEEEEGFEAGEGAHVLVAGGDEVSYGRDVGFHCGFEGPDVF